MKRLIKRMTGTVGKQYVQMLGEHSDSFRLVDKADATVFYDENDAENVLEMLNDTENDCYSLISA